MNKSDTAEMSEKEIDQLWQAVLERVDGPRYEHTLNGRTTSFWPIASRTLAAALLIGIGLFGWLRFGTRDSTHQVERQGAVAQTGPISLMKSEAPISSQRQDSIHSPIEIAQLESTGDHGQELVGHVGELVLLPTQELVEQNESEKQSNDSSLGDMTLTVSKSETPLPQVKGAGKTASIDFDSSERTSSDRLTDPLQVSEWPVVSRWSATQQQKISMSASVDHRSIQPTSAYEALGVPPPWKADALIDTNLIQKVTRHQEQQRYKLDYEYFAQSQQRSPAQTVGIRF